MRKILFNSLIVFVASTSFVFAQEMNNADGILLESEYTESPENCKPPYVDGVSKLLVEAGLGNLEKVKDLVGKGLSVNAQNPKGQSALHAAAIGGQLEVVQWLLENNAKINIQTIHKETPLHWAASQENHEVVKLLLDKGADVHIENQDGQTPIFASIVANNKQVMEVFLRFSIRRLIYLQNLKDEIEEFRLKHKY